MATTTALPCVHDLTPAQLRDLQRQQAQTFQLEPWFSDVLADGTRGPELAVIPAGLFEMGATGPVRRFGDQLRRFQPMETPFALGRYTVTAEEFERFSQASGRTWQEHHIQSEGRQPVININLQEARDYAAWLSDQTGQRYRLPTEAEWEYACLAGSHTAYCFGDRLTCGEANIHSLQAPSTPAKGWRRFLPFCVPLNKACEVGSFPGNVWGLHEMHGNVWEFTDTVWVGPVDAENSASGKRDGQWWVTKGGSWFEGALEARAASRKPRFYNELDLNLGVRLVRDL